jgi:hypothetical protein
MPERGCRETTNRKNGSARAMHIVTPPHRRRWSLSPEPPDTAYVHPTPRFRSDPDF